jgi:hypothetical protein
LARARQVGHVAHYLTGAIAADSEASQRADVAIQHILPIKSPKNCSILSRWGLQGVRSSANDGQVGENRVAQKSVGQYTPDTFGRRHSSDSELHTDVLGIGDGIAAGLMIAPTLAVQ